MPDLTPGQKLIMADEAGEFSHPSEMAKAIDAAIAHEREMCAKIAEEPTKFPSWEAAGTRIASAIRARSTSQEPVGEGAENDG